MREPLLSDQDDASARTTAHDEAPSSGGRPRGSARWLVLGVAALVFGPIGYREAPREMARWRIAIGTEAWLNGNYNAAAEEARKAARWAPDYLVPYGMLAKWELDGENYEASAAAAGKMIELAPREALGYELRSEAAWGRGRFGESLADLKHVVGLMEKQDEIPHQQRARVLNDLAYARALANTEIEEGLKDVNAAIQWTSPDAALLDTRGFLYYRAGDYQAALKDLNRAVREAESTAKRLAYLTKKRRMQSLLDPRQLKRNEKLINRNLAVMRRHRSLVWAKLGLMREAAADRLRVRELGFESNEQLY